VKKILYTLVFLLVWASCVHANAAEDMVTIPMADYKAILDKLDSLQKQVDVLKEDREAPRRQPPAVAQPAADSGEDDQAREMSDIYDVLDTVETRSLMDRIDFGAELRTRVDNFKVENHALLDTSNPAAPPKLVGLRDDSNDNHWSNRFRLNMSADIMEGLTFNGRLTVFKNWGDNDPSNMFGDFNAAHVPDDSTVKLDRAYVDWVPENSPIPVALTFGRHPSTEGPPAEFKENRQRQSTYPSLIFDAESEGLVVTFGLERYLGLRNSGLRFAYGKIFQSDDNMDSYLDELNSVDDVNIGAVFFETEIPSLDESLLVLSYIKTFGMVDNPLAPNIDIGDLELFGLHGQAFNLFDSGLDFFASFGLDRGHANGGSIPFLQVPDGAGGFNMVNGGLLSMFGEKDQTGYSIYSGLRYNIASDKLHNPKIGFEYNYGSQYWFSFTTGAELFNKLAVRGHVYDFYYIQPFNRYLFLRLGYTLVNYDYTGSGNHIGQPMDSDAKLRHFSAMLDCRF